MVALLLQVAVKCHGRQVACWPWSWLCPRGTALALHHSGPFGSSWTTCLAMRTAPRRTHAERSSCPLTGCLPMGGVGLRWGLRGWMVVAHLLGRLLDELLVACTKVGLLPARVVNLQARMAGGAQVLGCCFQAGSASTPAGARAPSSSMQERRTRLLGPRCWR